jgi:adenine phosphoribosyltransferase
VASVESALELVRTVPDFPEPGVLFRDLSPLFASPVAFGTVVDALAATVASDVDVIAPVEARGFLLGGALSVALGRALVPIRKPGKLPVVAHRVDYALEYGTATLELPASSGPA